MVATETHAPHAIGWVDLAAKDIDAAITFYAGLFGWTTFTEGIEPYVVFQVGETPVAGAMPLTPEMGEMPACWSAYVLVDDADATLKAATAAGGVILQEPFEVAEGQRVAVIGDPAGAAICLGEGMNENGIKMMDEPGAPCWFDCLSRDVDAAIAFYTTVFGWTHEAMEMDPGMTYHMFANQGQPTCGVMAMPPMVPAEVPSHWTPSFVVADTDKAAEFIAANGGTITVPPSDSPFGRMCGFLDPEGATINVIDRSTAV